LCLKFPIFYVFGDYMLNYCIALPWPRHQAFLNMFVSFVDLGC